MTSSRPFAEPSAESQPVTSLADIPISSSPNMHMNDSESHDLVDTELGMATNADDSDNHIPTLELPPYDQALPRLEKEIKTPDAALGENSPDLSYGSPITDLPNPYDLGPAPRKAFSTTNIRGLALESEALVLQRLPSVLRPANPKFVDSMDSKRASMSLGSLEFGLHPRVEEDGSQIVLENGVPLIFGDRRSFALKNESTSGADAPHGGVTRRSFEFDMGIPFVSTNGGLDVHPPMFVGQRVRRHSAVSAPCADTSRHSRFLSSSSPLSRAYSVEVESPNQERPQSDQRSDHGEGWLMDSLPSASRLPDQKKSPRWKFWSKSPKQ